MSLLEALVLGLVQGLTEFLPVSSSAHLVLVRWILGWEADPSADVAFDVVLHLGTLAAVVVHFRVLLRRVLAGVVRGLLRRGPAGDPDARLGWALVVGTVPAAVIGIGFQDALESLHGRPALVAGVLVVASGLLWLGERLGERKRSLDTLTLGDALFVGVAQSLALVPGVSRSAATIVGGLLRGFERPAAARFAFLLLLPAVLGAVAVKTPDLLDAPGLPERLLPLTVGFLAAAGSGWLCIRWLLDFLARRSLHGFAIYRVVVGGLLLAAWAAGWLAG